ncbi:hypothetical protein GJA_838 [Janthinobacterium agaricidamnosum NBRC 102515 = DSM 9628]|uniref:Uncharacterized protein n=1 Tax=Janthinobacterium agaricidamnosum NBRC 102515 = DSM 9628 TaxID=1349767 RepID=W0V1M1_9BURK|nr:hypothetical protein GJA_838 [Janthinobacterium agaricidamnosum NBRC 102515 = DSM 9628]
MDKAAAARPIQLGVPDKMSMASLYHLAVLSYCLRRYALP